MKTLEEQLWDFIDGNLSEKDQEYIQHKIDVDAEAKKLYNDFLSIQKMGYSFDLDVPSMSFTRNIMEEVEKLPAPVSLKTKVDNRIVYGIAVFFGLSILAVLFLAIGHSGPATEGITVKINLDFFEQKSLWVGFLFIDLIFALLFADYIIRKKLKKKHLAV